MNDLLQVYSAQPAKLSAWESHCLEQMMILLRFGYYEQAHRRVLDILEPPSPLPPFSVSRLMTIDDIRAALALLAAES